MLANIHGSWSECGWAGLAETHHWIDPVEDTIVMFMTPLIPAAAHTRSDLHSPINQPICRRLIPMA